MKSSEFRQPLAQALRAACLAEIDCFKPGNVSRQSPSADLSAADFEASAHAIAETLTEPGLSVGARILAAIKATRAVVSSNTNLGMVLLAAPLIQAAWSQTKGETLHAAVERELTALSIQDASDAYRAIRLAQPGGMGVSERHDIATEPTVTLFEAMQEAAERDTIALQYVSGYRHIFEFAVPGLREAMARWQSERWALLHTYLALLTRFPDSLLVRKYGFRVAREVGLQAVPILHAMQDAAQPQELMPQLIAWDRELKQNHYNPGTTADLSVAALLVVKLETLEDVQGVT